MNNLRKSLLILFALLGIFSPWAANAQNRSIIEIGTGTSVTWNLMPGRDGYRYDVYLYTPNASGELNDNNFTISSIAFDITDLTEKSGSTIEIWMKDVAADYALAAENTFSQYISGATKVVDAPFDTPEIGWNTIPFIVNTTFTHEMGKTLLIAVRGISCDGWSGCNRECRYTPISNIHWSWSHSPYDPGQNVPGYINDLRPNIRLAAEPAETGCANPTDFVVSNVTANSVLLTWVGEAANGFNVEYKKTSDADWTHSTNTHDNEWTLQGLESFTEYRVRLQAACGSEYSAWMYESFRTACGTITVDETPWTEDFEDFYHVTQATGWNDWKAYMMNDGCWDVNYGSIVNPALYTSYKPAAFSGSTSVQFTNAKGSATLILPEFTNALNTLQLEFKGSVFQPNNEGTIEIGYWHNGQFTAIHTGIQTFTARGANDNTNASSKYIGPYPLEGDIPSDSRIAIHYAVSTTSGCINIDDLRVSLKPSCYMPITFAASNVTSNSVTLSWEEVGEATTWVLEYGTNSDFSGATSLNVSDTPSVNLQHLETETTYYARVKSDCGGGDQSPYNTVEFTLTNCHDFGSGTTSANLVTTNHGSTYSQHIYTADELTAMGFSAGDIVSVSFYYSGTSSEYVKTQSIYIGTTTKSAYSNGSVWDFESNVTQVYGPTLLSYAAGWREYEFTEPFAWDGTSNIVVGLLTNSNDSSSEGWSSYGTVLSDYKTIYRYEDNRYIPIALLEITDGGGMSKTRPNIHLCIDPYARPKNLTAGTPTQNSVRLNWTPGKDDETQWQICLNNDETQLTLVDTHPYTLTGLTPETTYTVKVRAYYNESIQSNWSASVDFTTDVTCHAPAGLALAEGYPTAHEVSFTWNYEEGEVFQYAFPNGNVTDPSQVVFNTTWNAGEDFPSWSGLQAYTNRTFWLRKKCDDTDFSAPVHITFRTLEDCPAPTSFALVNNSITNHTATITWEGTSESYHVWYRAAANEDWQNVTTEETTYTLSGLVPETQYQVYVQGDCGSEGLSNPTATRTFTTDIPCPAPTRWQVVAHSIKSDQVDLSWRSYADAWQICINGDEDNLVDVAASDVAIEGDIVTYTLTGLAETTSYTVKMRANCGSEDGVSEWTSTLNFTTIAPCSVENVTFDNITHHTATVNWTGDSENGYTVYYRTIEQLIGMTEDFPNPYAPLDWTEYSGLLHDVMNGTATLSSTSGYWDYYNDFVFNSRHARLTIFGSERKSWLVTPEVNLANGATLQFDLALTDRSSSNNILVPNGQADDRFVVLITTDNMDTWHILREWNNSGSEYVYNAIPNSPDNHITIDLSSYTGNVKIAFYGESTATAYNENTDIHIDNVAIGVIVPAGEWQTETADSDANSANLSGLASGTIYELKVAPNCDNPIESDIANLTTMSPNEKHFITAGDWHTADNWLDGEIPSDDDNAILHANVTITGLAEANFITQNNNTVTIEDGGQLRHNHTQYIAYINATVKKNITGYGGNNNGGWNFIATPIMNGTTPNINNGFLAQPAANYDLYYYDEAAHYWRNYKESEDSQSPHFSLSNGKGYLYANHDNIELQFEGTLQAGTDGSYTVSNLSYACENESLQGFNLVGNPFVCNATINQPFYVINGRNVVANTGSSIIPPCTGVMVKATESGQSVTFTKTTAQQSAQPRQLQLTLAQQETNRSGASATIDNAIVSFSKGDQLEKFCFGDNAQIFIPQDNKDYAIAFSEGRGEMPLNFKATKNGTYTITIAPEGVEMVYLHLIDNMTGADVDLLAATSTGSVASYTFTARTTDYESRFKLVFACGDGPSTGSGTFAYISNGNIIVNGEGTLQVVDVMGRIIRTVGLSQCGNHITTAGMPAGVYVLRLINGENIKTQKIVIE